MNVVYAVIHSIKFSFRELSLHKWTTCSHFTSYINYTKIFFVIEIHRNDGNYSPKIFHI